MKTEARETIDRFKITDRVVIVTGGAGLLGRAHAMALASAGGNVVLADVQEQAAEKVAEEVRLRTGGDCLAVKVDVTQAESVSALIEESLERYGRIDILVNNAALDPKFDVEPASLHSRSFEDYPLEAWQQSMDVNITGMFLCAQGVAPAMLEAGQGVIVNVSSTYGVVGPDQRLYEREGQPAQYKPVTYSVTKAAVLGLTRYLATYYQGKGIRVNALTPGGVYAGHDDEFVRRYSAKTILGRMAEKEEISSALLFLVSDASSYMTGANLVVDGGWTAW